MANSRVVFISEITVGSKFRTIANRTAQVKAARKRGTSWASCIPKESGSNFQLPSFTDVANPPIRRHTILNATFGYMTVFAPMFNIFNRPCPWMIGHAFKQRSDP